MGIRLDNCGIRDIVYAKLIALTSWTKMNAYILIISLVVISELLVLIRGNERVPVVAV